MIKYNNIYRKIISEMSAKANPIMINAKEYQTQWEAKKDSLDRDQDIDINGNILNIYLFNIGNFLQLYFVHNESVVVAYIESEVLQDGGFREGFIWSSGYINPLMSKIYSEYLLDNFNYIISDEIHTAKGFSMWCRFVDDPSLQVKVINTVDNTEKIVSNNNEMKDYYGEVDKMKYVFSLSKND